MHRGRGTGPRDRDPRLRRGSSGLFNADRIRVVMWLIGGPGCFCASTVRLCARLLLPRVTSCSIGGVSDVPASRPTLQGGGALEAVGVNVHDAAQL